MNITPHVVKQLLKKHGFVERKMQKAVTMKDCKDRNEQFEKIHKLKEEYSKSENPIISMDAVSYTHLRAHETPEHLVCRLLLEKKKKKKKTKNNKQNNRHKKKKINIKK